MVSKDFMFTRLSVIFKQNFDIIILKEEIDSSLSMSENYQQLHDKYLRFKNHDY